MKTSRSLFPTILVISLALALAVVPCAPAFADSIAVKQAEADRVQKQISALNDRAEIASERYNEAATRYSQLTDKVHATERKIAKLQKQQRHLQGHLDTRVSEMYRSGSLGFLTVLLSVRSYDQFDATMRVLSTLNAQDAATVAQLKQSKAEAQQARATLASAQKRARQQKLAMAANAAAVKQQLAARKQLLASLDAQIQALMARQIAQQSIAQQTRTMAVLLRQRTASTGGITLGGPAPENSKALGAVYWAEKQLGKPYVWAAAGPDTFDCSGLMLFAYARVGINLNHFSGDQINQGRRVARSDLQPGDLVFFGSPIHHVGMYVGGGCFIEAPYTGTDVRISEMSSRGDFAGACRPAQ